jgi:hypothetical protein
VARQDETAVLVLDPVLGPDSLPDRETLFAGDHTRQERPMGDDQFRKSRVDPGPAPHLEIAATARRPEVDWVDELEAANPRELGGGDGVLLRVTVVVLVQVAGGNAVVADGVRWDAAKGDGTPDQAGDRARSEAHRSDQAGVPPDSVWVGKDEQPILVAEGSALRRDTGISDPVEVPRRFGQVAVDRP